MPQNWSLRVRDDLLDRRQRFVVVLAPHKRIPLLQQALPRHHGVFQVWSRIRETINEPHDTPE